MDWLIPADHFAEHVLVALVALVVTGLVVLFHFEGIQALARRFSGRARRHDRRSILWILYALLGLHILEIWCYGLAYWWLVKFPETGFVHGEHGMDHLFDAVYFSAMTYSTVGFGDLSPVGAVRLLSGMEAITGLLLITWSASFTYLEMSRLWEPGRE
jgi:hypothetical protein